MSEETARRVPPNPWEARNPVHALVLAAATCAGLGLCLILALPFFKAFTWALTLAILFLPLHRRLESRLHRRGVTSLITVLTAAFIVVIPLALVAHQLFVHAAAGITTLDAKLDSGELENTFNRFPQAVRALSWLSAQVDLPSVVGSVGTWLTQSGASFVKGSIEQAVTLALTFYLLFYIVRDHRQAVGALRELSPLSREETTMLLRRITDTVHATVFGTLVVATVQGLLGGLMFWWLGIPGSLFWGLVMGLLAVIPVLGAFIVWIPAALLLLLSGQWGKALILVAWGLLVVGTIDNLLGPILVGRRLRLHTVHIFVSLVGGLILAGTAGLVLGPVILAGTLALLEIWRRRTADPAAP